MLYFTVHYTLAWQVWANSVDPDENVLSHQGIHCLPIIQLYLDTTFGSIKVVLVQILVKYGKELRCLNTKGKHSKITDTEIKWSIFSKL